MNKKHNSETIRRIYIIYGDVSNTLNAITGTYQVFRVKTSKLCILLGQKSTEKRKRVKSAGARSKNSTTNHSTFQKKSELFSIGGGHVVPVVNNTTCFSIYKWLLFLLLFSSYFPLLS